jgi:hypothetical protein
MYESTSSNWKISHQYFRWWCGYFVLGQVWEVLSVHNTRRANVVGSDHEAAVKRNLLVVSSITAVDLPHKHQ